MKTILCIAETCCDIIFGQLNRIPTLGEEEYCKYFSIKAGGGANTPMGLARLGVATSYLTRLGDDGIGNLTLDFMRDMGLDTSQVQIAKGSRTPVSAVMSTKTDRCFASFGGDDRTFVSEELLEREISRADHIHTFIGYCLQYPIMELCKKYNKTLSLDSSWTENMDIAELEPYISYSSLFAPNDKEAMVLTGMDNVEDALIQLAKISPGTVITLGEKGSIALVDGKIHHQESINMGPTVDSTGAGDIFCSGLLYGFIKDFSMKKSMEIASYIAGYSVTYYGGVDKKLSIDSFANLFV